MPPVVVFPLQEMVPPRVQIPDTGDGLPPQMVTIILRPSGDPNRDIRRIARLHGTFISYPGKDRFAFQIFEQERGFIAASRLDIGEHEIVRHVELIGKGGQVGHALGARACV